MVPSRIVLLVLPGSCLLGAVPHPELSLVLSTVRVVLFFLFRPTQQSGNVGRPEAAWRGREGVIASFALTSQQSSYHLVEPFCLFFRWVDALLKRSSTYVQSN